MKHAEYYLNFLGYSQCSKHNHDTFLSSILHFNHFFFTTLSLQYTTNQKMNQTQIYFVSQFSWLTWCQIRHWKNMHKSTLLHRFSSRNDNGLKVTPRGKILNVIKWLENNEFWVLSNIYIIYLIIHLYYLFLNVTI